MNCRICCFKLIQQEKILWLNIIVTMLSNFTYWKQWHHQQIKWRQQARKISGEEQSFRGLGRYRFEIKGDMQALPKILLERKEGTYEVPAVETGLLGELHPVLLQTHQKAADVNYQRSPPASRLWSSLKRSFEMYILGRPNWIADCAIQGSQTLLCIRGLNSCVFVLCQQIKS